MESGWLMVKAPVFLEPTAFQGRPSIESFINRTILRLDWNIPFYTVAVPEELLDITHNGLAMSSFTTLDRIMDSLQATF